LDDLIPKVNAVKYLDVDFSMVITSTEITDNYALNKIRKHKIEGRINKSDFCCGKHTGLHLQLYFARFIPTFAGLEEMEWTNQ